MKAKTILIVCMLAIFATPDFCIEIQAQTATGNKTPQKIPAITIEEFPYEWYEEQNLLWKAEIDRNPQNEDAWYYYYKSARYMASTSQDEQEQNRLDMILLEMEKAIPDTYTLYVIQYYHQGNIEKGKNIVKAMEMRPDNIEMFPDYVSYLLQTGNEKKMAEVLKKWYDSGTYSPNLLNYSYNELCSTKDSAIIFVNGDSPIYSKLLLQYGKGLFKDRCIIGTSMLSSEVYLKHLAKKLNIPEFKEIDFSKEDAPTTYEEYDYRQMMHIIENTDRPVYLSLQMIIPSMFNNLYHEGLLLHYSKEEYDNMAVMRRNYENLYLTDYLRESFSPELYPYSAKRYNSVFIDAMIPLLHDYKENGDTARHKELYELLKGIILNTEMEEKYREYYLEAINE